MARKRGGKGKRIRKANFPRRPRKHVVWNPKKKRVALKRRRPSAGRIKPRFRLRRRRVALRAQRAAAKPRGRERGRLLIRRLKPPKPGLKRPIAKPPAPARLPAPPRPAKESGLSIETNPDRLYRMVNAKGSVLLADAAKTFGVEERRVEEWAEILEDHSLLRLHYPTFGKPILQRIGSGEKEKRPHRRAGKRPLFKAAVLAVLLAILLRQYLLPGPLALDPSFLGSLSGPLVLDFSFLKVLDIPFFGGTVNLLPLLLIIIAALAVAVAVKRRRGRRGKR